MLTGYGVAHRVRSVKTRSPIGRSILVSAVVYLAVQCGLYTLTWLLMGASWRLSWVFYPVTALFHFLILGGLLWRKADLRRTSDGVALERVNLPCHLTLVRLSSTPTLVFLAAAGGSPAMGALLLGLAAVVFVTDFFDGRIARARGETTVMGSYLDSSSDYVVLLSVGVSFTLLGIVPVWYAVVLMVRLGVHALGMGLVSLVRRRVDPETTFLGKVGVAAAMVVCAFQVARWYAIPALGDPTVVGVAEISGAVVLAVSLGEKVVYLVRKLRSPALPPPPG